MKTKKFNKSLRLNKSTVADLDNYQMSKVQGGTRPSLCVPCTRTCHCNTSFADPCDCNTSDADPCDCNTSNADPCNCW